MSTQTNNPPFPPQSSTPGAHRDLALCKTPPFIKWPSVSVTKKRFHTGDIWFRAVNVPAHRAAIGGETLRPRGWTGATLAVALAGASSRHIVSAMLHWKKKN